MSETGTALTPEAGGTTATPGTETTPATSVNPLATEGGTQPAQAGEKQTDGKTDAPAGAPETYGDFTMPDGIEVNEELMSKFLPLAKELNLTQEDAQKLVDLQTAEAGSQAQAQEDQWEELQEGWVNQAKADREIGGSEAEFNSKVAIALQALEKFGTPELSEALTVTGAGNHPELIRFCYRVGKAIASDTVIPGRTPGQSSEKSLAQSLFPSMANP